MAINLLAIISIVFVFVIGAIVALFVLHFKKKKSSAQVATNAEDISNLQTNVASLTKKTDWGPWTISHTSDAFNICHNGETQLNLHRETAVPPGAKKPGSGLAVQYLYSNQMQTNRMGFPSDTIVEIIPPKGKEPGIWVPAIRNPPKKGVFNPYWGLTKEVEVKVGKGKPPKKTYVSTLMNVPITPC